MEATRTMLFLGIVIMFYSYYYFSFGMSLSIILESLSSLDQRETFIYNRFYFAGFKKFAKNV